ncbi:hypothetical protein PFISCL1PPCAC_25460 [Pristionchus fissidentatus]|uniref:Uncharacterized protein n=1 Tax=Pristionchus fissidentatus TaxID=1538716 RepID=A0AAV5WU73_9BILA|nr:hypothetical protein PFISCL1PPCAC_25460 [Pristionchus fissidentatus]
MGSVFERLEESLKEAGGEIIDNFAHKAGEKMDSKLSSMTETLNNSGYSLLCVDGGVSAEELLLRLRISHSNDTSITTSRSTSKRTTKNAGTLI